MARGLELDELVESFTLLPDEFARLRNKSGATRLGFALLLRFFTLHGRFPSGHAELADEVVKFVAAQVGVPASELSFYDWSGRQIKAHRAEVRRALGFRECGVEDADKLTDWAAAAVAETERRPEQVRIAVLGRCREERIEPPSRARLDRIVAAALHRAEETLFARVVGRLPARTAAQLRALIADSAGPDADAGVDADLGEGGTMDAEDYAAGPARAGSPLAWIKSDPGNVSLDSMLTEIDKLTAVRRVGVPAATFADVAPKVVAGWRARAAVESPSLRKQRPAVLPPGSSPPGAARADDPVNPARGRLLDPLLPAMLQQLLAHPLGPAFPLADLLSQPRGQLLRIAHRALAEAQEPADLGAVVLHRAAVPLVKRQVRRGNRDLVRHIGHRIIRQFTPTSRKPTMPGIKLEQKRETQARRSALAGNLT